MQLWRTGGGDISRVSLYRCPSSLGGGIKINKTASLVRRNFHPSLNLINGEGVTRRRTEGGDVYLDMYNFSIIIVLFRLRKIGRGIGKKNCDSADEGYYEKFINLSRVSKREIWIFYLLFNFKFQYQSWRYLICIVIKMCLIKFDCGVALMSKEVHNLIVNQVEN